MSSTRSTVTGDPHRTGRRRARGTRGSPDPGRRSRASEVTRALLGAGPGRRSAPSAAPDGAVAGRRSSSVDPADGAVDAVVSSTRRRAVVMSKGTIVATALGTRLTCSAMWSAVRSCSSRDGAGYTRRGRSTVAALRVVHDLAAEQFDGRAAESTVAALDELEGHVRDGERLPAAEEPLRAGLVEHEVHGADGFAAAARAQPAGIAQRPQRRRSTVSTKTGGGAATSSARPGAGERARPTRAPHPGTGRSAASARHSSGNSTTTSHAPSVNFTTAKISTTSGGDHAAGEA